MRCTGQAMQALCEKSQLGQTESEEACPPEPDTANADSLTHVRADDVQMLRVENGKEDEAWDWCSEDASIEPSIPTIQTLPHRPKITVGRSSSTPTSISTEASNLLRTDMQSESCETDQECLCIPADASLLEGVRLLVWHHLGKSLGETALTPKQKQLVERHVLHLTRYAERLKQTILSTMVFDHGQGTDVQESLEQDVSFAASSSTGTEPRQVRLRDSELLEIYRNAQAEAGREADWRGLSDHADHAAASQGWRYEWLRQLRQSFDRGGLLKAAGF